MFRRILMNAADVDTTGSGGGVAAAQPASPAPAAAASPAPLTVEAMLEAVKDPAMRDAFFSAGRKSGLFRDRPAKPSGEPTTTTPAQPAADQSVADIVQAEISRSRAFDRALLFSGVELTPTQADRIERAYKSEKPANPSEWVSEFIADMGLTKKVAAATTVTPPIPQPQSLPAAPAPTPAPAQPPVTNVGAPAALNSPLENRNLLKLTESETAELIKQHGVTKVRQLLREQMSKTGFRTK